MPTYNYVCKGCGHRFEELQSFSEPVLTKCPVCKKKKLERLFGGGGAIIFKGTGFYETDYRRPGEAKANGTPDAAPAETKADAKPDAKPDAAPAAAASPPPPPPATGGSAKAENAGGAKKKT